MDCMNWESFEESMARLIDSPGDEVVVTVTSARFSGTLREGDTLTLFYHNGIRARAYRMATPKKWRNFRGFDKSDESVRLSDLAADFEILEDSEWE